MLGLRNDRQVVTRFAPSPTGWLHLGHAFSAWTAWRAARASGGKFLLRLEDIDPDRCRRDYADAIEEDLSWLGLSWDGPVLRQSDRLALYRACLDRLAARALVYPCFCSRADIRREVAASASAPHAPDGAPLYPGTCRGLAEEARAARMAAGAPHAWRLDMGRALAASPALVFTECGEGDLRAEPGMFGDVVLGRRDAPASYHLCVTHDDAAQGVTLVTRGDDLKPATHLHRLLQQLMGWPAPVYAHHALLRTAEGQRLSKRDGAKSLRALREAGLAPASILASFEARAAVLHGSRSL
jgi:glutamyl-Q tRNA(Asp) synthetase